MRTIRDILDKEEIEQIILYLFYGDDNVEEMLGKFDKKIEMVYDDFFSQLEKMFPEADRKDGKLVDAVSDFVKAHDEVFMTLGIALGYELRGELLDHKS